MSKDFGCVYIFVYVLILHKIYFCMYQATYPYRTGWFQIERDRGSVYSLVLWAESFKWDTPDKTEMESVTSE